MAFGNLLKAVVITLLGFAAVGLTTWGLVVKAENPDGVMMAVSGLIAYLLIWSLGLFMISGKSPV